MRVKHAFIQQLHVCTHLKLKHNPLEENPGSTRNKKELPLCLITCNKNCLKCMKTSINQPKYQKTPKQKEQKSQTQQTSGSRWEIMHLFSEKGVGHLFLTAFLLAVLRITLYYPACPVPLFSQISCKKQSFMPSQNKVLLWKINPTLTQRMQQVCPVGKGTKLITRSHRRIILEKEWSWGSPDNFRGNGLPQSSKEVRKYKDVRTSSD